MRYMLDTNICVNLMRKKSANLLREVTSHPISDICISSITVAELFFGVQKSSRPVQNQQAVEQFIVTLTILDFNSAAANEYGRVRAYLEMQGTPIGSLDTLIAAHALSRNLVLVTSNSREFSRVPGLVVEDWLNR